MEQHLVAFAESHPDGWDHQAWLGLLGDLEAHGIDVSDPERIGLELERVRLAEELRRRKISGLGPKRIEAIVDRFQTLWRLRQAEAEEVAEIGTIPSALAEKVAEAIR